MVLHPEHVRRRLEEVEEGDLGATHLGTEDGRE